MDEILAELKKIRETQEQILASTAGSWSWDKRTGILTMFDIAGKPSLVFEVKNSPESASRERRLDLE